MARTHTLTCTHCGDKVERALPVSCTPCKEKHARERARKTRKRREGITGWDTKTKRFV